MTPPPLKSSDGATAINGQAGLDARTPLLLLPVHIQTRFVDGAGSVAGQGANVQSELWVRIYPDQIAVNSHEPDLTARENDDGQAYWNAVWIAGNPAPNSDDAIAPWRVLASRYGPQRAAWIALALTPTNVTLQPSAPVPPGATPVPVPVFPVVTLRDSSWEKAATADALPDAWTVVLVSGANTVQFRGSPIVTPLAVSLTPNGTGFPAGSHVDAGLQWMVDFPTALAAGMALKIPLTAQQRASGFDTVLVYGTRSADATASQTLTDLLNAHHYTDGFALVLQGAPTNNTPDANSAFSRKDPNYDLSFATERAAPLTANPACDGDVLLNALGLLPGTLDHVAYADGTGSSNGTDMLQALWEATLGYFLSQMMADVFTPSQIEQARQYVMANGVPRGPLPAMRVGRMPYGVLPVTSLRNYPAETFRGVASLESSLATFVKKLWPTWLNSSSAAPHMQRGGDPDQNLMSLLGMDASSENYQGRPVLGSDFTWNLFSFFGVPQAFQGQWWQNYFFFGRALLNAFGFGTWNPKLLGFAFGEKSFPVGFPIVQSAPVSETDLLADDADLGGGKKGNYIEWIAKASVADLQAENYPGVKPTSLLYKILRQSMLLAYSNNAGTAEVTAGTLAIAQIRESEFVSVQPATTTLTPLQILARPAIPNPHLTWADYLVTTKFGIGSPFAGLADMKASMGRLAELPTAELERLFTETLDVCSHRLDVWATTIANALLKRTRAAQNNSISLGCYGWVENVVPETGRTPVQGTELRQVELLDAARRTTKLANLPLPVPKQPLTDNGGYVLAPSQTQAAVAAVLRNGYMTHKQTAEEGLLSIDLSSERVRRAIWLIEGVQQGQSLNALLGYLFEDAMHDRNLDKYIQPFRDAFPVIGNKLTPSSAPSQSVAASNVVDGLALRTAWDTGKLPTGGNWGPGLPIGGDQNSVIAILQVIDDYADALGDLSISEAVFQAVRGNFGGAALMDAISRGSRPPLPDIVNTPRGGLDLSHRIAIIIAGPPATAAAWSGITIRPRAAAEPWLDGWLSGLLPDPSIVRCEVAWQDSGGSHSVTVSLRDLDIGPLDLLSLADAAEVPQQSELERRILFQAGVPAGAVSPQIVFQSASLPAGSILFLDVLYLAQKLRALIGAARPLGPQDMTVPENNAAKAGGALNLVDLTVRATAAILSLNNDTQALVAAAAPNDIRTALMQCSAYGVSGSVPGSASGTDANLATQAANVIAELQNRSKKASAVNLATAQLADFESVFEAIFGSDFVVLPQFTPPDLGTLQAAFSQSAALVSSDTVAPSRWLRQLTHVHPAVSRFDMALSAAQALSGGSIYPPSLTLGQLPPPVTPPDRWLGLPLDPAHPPEKGRVAIACLAAGDPSSQSIYAGLLIDEWNERIPVVPVNASLAFHYEEPNARAPQSLLLAVCPDGRSVWDDGLIQAVLEETLELAKIRSVDLASIEQVGQILPALYFALNLQGATFSTHFAVLKEVISGIGNIAARVAG